MRRGNSLVLILLLLGACASSQKAGSGTTTTPGGGVPTRDVSSSEKAEFTKVVADWRAASKDGLSPDECDKLSKAFEEVADDNPKLVEARYDQGAVLERCGRLKEARSIYEKALDAAPNYSRALAGLGRLTMRDGDEGRAYEFFDRAVKADAKNDDAYLGRAMILHERAKKGDGQAAKDSRNDLRRALAVDAYNMHAYATLALLEYDLAGNDQEKLDMARLVTEQARKITAPDGSPLGANFAPIHNVAGLIALKRNNVTAALASFKKAAELDPNLLEAYMNIGAITLNFRDYQTAEQSFRHVLKSQPQNFDALIGLGVALRGLRNVKDAEKYYLEAGKANPDNPAVLYNMGILYQDYREQTTEQLNKAKDYFTQFLSRAQDKAKIEDAKNRIKNIDDTFRALEEAKKMQAEMDRMQRQMEEQQRKMEEQMKQQQGAQPAAPAPAKPK